MKGGGASRIRAKEQVGGQASPAHAQKHARAAAGARKGWRRSASPESGGRARREPAHARARGSGAEAHAAPPCDARGAPTRPREARAQLPPPSSRRLSKVGRRSKWSRVESWVGSEYVVMAVVSWASRRTRKVRRTTRSDDSRAGFLLSSSSADFGPAKGGGESAQERGDYLLTFCA